MQLINCKTLQVQDCFPGGRPPYAIISHTWAQPGNGNPAEVTYDDFRAGRAKSPDKNWDKIDQAVRIASLEGLDYVWLDTCCIDKRNSSELSEAINSMFKWYAEAAVCYAHIADFDSSNGIGGLGACRWFRRGWTLQELIAPSRVEFYDRQWNHFGSRESLSREIAAITNIDQAALTRTDGDIVKFLMGLTVAKRMSWADRRITTRPEDMAYCLLGLFNVNMPMQYGEGEKAFIRLQEEIMKDTDDMTLFAWKAVLGGDGGHVPKFRGIFARNPQEFAKSAHLVPTVEAGFSPDFAMSNKGLHINTSLHHISKSDDLWMPLSCQDSCMQEIGISLRHKGANRYVRSQPEHLIALTVDSRPVTTGGVLIDKNVEILTNFEAKPPELDEQVYNADENSFLFDFDSFQLEIFRVSHPVRWDQEQKLLKTSGQRGFVGAVFMNVKWNESNSPVSIPIVVACGLGSRSLPWICLSTTKEYYYARETQPNSSSRLYEAAMAQDWESVRLAVPGYYDRMSLTLKDTNTGGPGLDVHASKVPTGIGFTKISLRVRRSAGARTYVYGGKLGTWAARAVSEVEEVLSWPSHQASKLKEKLEFRSTSSLN